MQNEVIRQLDITETVEGTIKNRILLVFFNSVMLIVSILFLLSGIQSLMTSRKSSVITTIPITIYLMLIASMLAIHIMSSVSQIRSLKHSPKVSLEYMIRAAIPLILSAITFLVLASESYRFLCLDRTVSKMKKYVAVWSILISSTVALQSAWMLWKWGPIQKKKISTI
jgi:hypothetical protein